MILGKRQVEVLFIGLFVTIIVSCTEPAENSTNQEVEESYILDEHKPELSSTSYAFPAKRHPDDECVVVLPHWEDVPHLSCTPAPTNPR